MVGFGPRARLPSPASAGRREGQSSEGSQRCCHRSQPPVPHRGRPGFGPRCLPVPGMVRAGSEREWTLEGNKAHGRIGCSSAGNGGATLRTRRRSKALKSAARVVSMSPPGAPRCVGRAAQWSGGLGRRTARKVPSGASLCPPACAGMACRLPRDSTALVGASALRGEPVKRVRVPVRRYPCDPVTWGSAVRGGSELHRTRDDGPCQRVIPGSGRWWPRGSWFARTHLACRGFGRGRGGTSAGNGKKATDRGDAVPAVDEDTLRRV